jgi:hypothetical protein
MALFQNTPPTITTVSQSGIKMGNRAAKMLIDRLESEEEHDRKKTINEVIETHLMKRLINYGLKFEVICSARTLFLLNIQGLTSNLMPIILFHISIL